MGARKIKNLPHSLARKEGPLYGSQKGQERVDASRCGRQPRGVLASQLRFSQF